MDSAALWRLYSGLNFLSTSLVRAALLQETRGGPPSVEVQGVAASRKHMYAMIEEAALLLPLFDRFTMALVNESSSLATPVQPENGAPHYFLGVPTRYDRARDGGRQRDCWPHHSFRVSAGPAG